MNKYIYLFALTVFCASSIAEAQDSTAVRSFFDEGLSMRGGVGSIAVRDEFISDEKYNGSIPFFGVGWSRFHGTYGFRLIMEFQSTSNLKNYNLSAALTQFKLGLDYLYPIGDFQLMSRNVQVYLGPTSELFIHYRQENIAQGGAIDAYSFLLLVSGGLRSEAWMPISSDLQLHANAQTSVISLGGKLVDPESTNESMVKLLTIFSGLNANAGLGVSYRVTGGLVADASYRFDITRVNAWDFFISGNDNFILSISYGF